jgi:hypothetical protein
MKNTSERETEAVGATPIKLVSRGICYAALCRGILEKDAKEMTSHSRAGICFGCTMKIRDLGSV